MTTPAPLSGVVDVASLMADSVFKDRWATSTFVTKLTKTFTTGTTTGVFADAPPLEDALIFNPGTRIGNDYGRGFDVYSVVQNPASTTYTVKWTYPTQGGEKAGSLIKIIPTGDGLHPSSFSQMRGMQGVINAKNAGLFGVL
jgi:hypothetical protein